MTTNNVIHDYFSYKNGRCTDLQYLKHQYIGENNPGTVTKLNILSKKSKRSYFFYVIQRKDLKNYDGLPYDEYKIIDLEGDSACILKKTFLKNDKNVYDPTSFWDFVKNDIKIRDKISFYRDCK